MLLKKYYRKLKFINLKKKYNNNNIKIKKYSQKKKWNSLNEGSNEEKS